MAKEIPEEMFFGHVGQKVILEKDGKVLMCQGVGTSPWDFPGGRLHKEEDLQGGLLREIKEELNIEIEIGDVFDVCVAHETKVGIPRFLVVYKGSFIDDPSQIKCAEDEIASVGWIGKEDVEKLETAFQWREILKKYFELT